MNRLQFIATVRLAVAFHHEWAGQFYQEAETPQGELFTWSEGKEIPFVEQIHERTEADRWEHSIAGISSPTYSCGIISHTTHTGRTAWVIRKNVVDITISRPQGQLLVFELPLDRLEEVEVHPASQDEHMASNVWSAGDLRISDYSDSRTIYLRHMEAAKEAIAALIGKEKADVVFSPELMALAKPDEIIPEEKTERLKLPPLLAPTKPAWKE